MVCSSRASKGLRRADAGMLISQACLSGEYLCRQKCSSRDQTQKWLNVYLLIHMFLDTYSFHLNVAWLYSVFFPSFLKSISPEDSEKRRTNYQAYRSYLNREGPKALGSKEIPKVSSERACLSVRASGPWVHARIQYFYSSRKLIIKN